MIDFAELSQFWSVAVAHGEAKAAAVAPLAPKITSAFSGQGAVERTKVLVYIGISTQI